MAYRAVDQPEEPFALGHRRIGFAITAVLFDIGLGNDAERIGRVDLGGALVALLLLGRVNALGQARSRLVAGLPRILQLEVGIGAKGEFLLHPHAVAEFQPPELSARRRHQQEKSFLVSHLVRRRLGLERPNHGVV